MKAFIFGHCRKMLGRLLHFDLKTYKFLACTDTCADFDESLSPTKRLYSNRQARNVYRYILIYLSTTPEYIITGCNGTIPRFVNKAMQVVTRIFIGNNNKTVWGNLFTESTDMLRLTEGRFSIKMFPFYFHLINGGKGETSLISLYQLFPSGSHNPSGRQAKSNINSLLPINL